MDMSPRNFGKHRKQGVELKEMDERGEQRDRAILRILDSGLCFSW